MKVGFAAMSPEVLAAAVAASLKVRLENNQKPEVIARRFWAKVNKSSGVFKLVQGEQSECWTWQSSMLPKGYGTTKYKGKGIAAYKLAYMLSIGPVPDGLELDHLCRTRRCVRPDHLEPITHLENIRRGICANREKATCLKGHPFDVIRKSGKRDCSVCHKALVRAYHLRKKQEREQNAIR